LTKARATFTKDSLVFSISAGCTIAAALQAGSLAGAAAVHKLPGRTTDHSKIIRKNIILSYYFAVVRGPSREFVHGAQSRLGVLKASLLPAPWRCLAKIAWQAP